MSISLPTETPNSSFYSKLEVLGLGTYEIHDITTIIILTSVILV